jgi:type II secretory pathway pseudopilin PulG
MRVSNPSHRALSRGATLIEAVIAVGVLAVAIPLVFGALVEGGRSGASSQAETRSTWMIPACMDEIRASRDGKPQYFTPTHVGEAFPPAGDVWALAFSQDGRPVGKMSKALYDKGARELDGKPIRYIASIKSTPDTVKAGMTPMLKVQISLEYPSAVKSAKRYKFDFHTRIP